MKNPLSILPERFSRRMPSALRAMTDMENEMDRWFRGATDWPEEIQTLDFSPSADIKESDTEYLVRFDVPGVKKSDVKIELANNRLTVSGERKETKEEKDAKQYLSESYYGSFMRSFTLPAAVDDNKVHAQYEDGVLTIKIPKLNPSKAKEIKVH